MTAPLTFGQPPTDNALYYGDCLDWMREWQSETVDLIYLDPPFNSKQDYNMLYSADVAGDAQYRAFADTWVWDDAAADRYGKFDGQVGAVARTIRGLCRMLGECGMLAYLTYMAERLVECHRLLKPTGSIYLHCDPTASHYLKTLMDSIFGSENFRNELVWKRFNFHADAKRKFGALTDRLLFYGSTSASHPINRVRVPYSKAYVETKFQRRDKSGRRYRLENLNAPGGRGPVYEFCGITRPWRMIEDKMRALDAQGRIYKDSRVPQLIRFLDEMPGQAVGDLWADIPPINPRAKERLGYPTQKPLALLERIIRASSNKGDLVLDPFCGCGTAVDGARGLGRRWIGIDISSFAVDVMLQRLGDRTIPVYGIPYDLHSARRMATDDPFGFESWAVSRLRGFVPNTKQVADGGIDGRARLAVKPDDWTSRLALAQVKGGKYHPIDGLRAFSSVVDSRKAALGCYITVEPFDTDSARKVFTNPSKIHVGGYPYRRFNRWSIADYFDERSPPLPPMNNPYTGKPMAQGVLF